MRLFLFPNTKYLFSLSHLFHGSQEADVHVSPVVVSLQQLHNLQDNDRMIDVINIVQ